MANKTFTTHPIRDNLKLKQFLYNIYKSDKSRVVGDSLYTVYNIDTAISLIDKKIDKFKDDARMSKHIVRWEGYREIIEGLR